MSDGHEKRKFERYENLPVEEPIMARFQIRSDTQETGSDDWDSANLLNISVGGTFFCSKKDLGIGTLLDLKIDLPKSTSTINCVGEVIRIEQFEPTSVFTNAIKFIDIGEQEKEMINTTVEKFLEYNIAHF
jgi:PilZ domain